MSDGTKCPTCGEDRFKNKNSMRSHHKQAHGYSIAYEVIQCKSCGTNVRDIKSKEREYCLECARNHDMLDEESYKKISEANSGEDNPMFGMTGEDSPMYGRTGEAHPMYGETHTEEAKRKISKSISGKNNPMYGVTGEDHHMYGVTGEDHYNYGRSRSKEFKQRLSECFSGEGNPMFGLRGEDHPASEYELTEEERRKLSDAKKGTPRPDITGEKHPLWKEDTTNRFSIAYYKNREKVIKRDGGECVVCGMGRGEHLGKYEEDVSVHHIIPRNEFIDSPTEKPPDEAGAMKNLVTLCKGCHKPVEVGNVDIEDYVNGDRLKTKSILEVIG